MLSENTNSYEVFTTGSDAWLPLHWAVASGHEQAVEEMLSVLSERQNKPPAVFADQRTGSGMSCVEIAARSGYVPVLKVLMLSDADIGGERGTSIVALTLQHHEADIPRFILRKLESVSSPRQAALIGI